MDRWLEPIAELYHRDKSLAWNTPLQRKKAAEDAAKALQRAHDAIARLRICSGGYLLTDEDGEPLVDAGAMLRAATNCAQAAERIPDIQVLGKPPDIATQHLVQKLHRLYTQQTGKTHRYTHGRDRDGYHGPFVDFAVNAAAEMGIELTPKRIAQCLDSAPLARKI
jgi:hypothetical protein